MLCTSQCQGAAVFGKVERGNHEALLSAGKNYSGMWKRQAAGIMEDDPSEETRNIVRHCFSSPGETKLTEELY